MVDVRLINILPTPQVPTVPSAQVTQGGSQTSPSLASIPVGTTLNGFIINRDAGGNPILRTESGDIAFESNFFLKIGSEVSIRIQVSGGQSLARILTVNGQPPEIATGQSAFAQDEGVLLPSSLTGQQASTRNAPLQAAAIPAATQINTSPTVSLTATLLSPPTDTVQTQAGTQLTLKVLNLQVDQSVQASTQPAAATAAKAASSPALAADGSPITTPSHYAVYAKASGATPFFSNPAQPYVPAGVQLPAQPQQPAAPGAPQAQPQSLFQATADGEIAITSPVLTIPAGQVSAVEASAAPQAPATTQPAPQPQAAPAAPAAPNLQANFAAALAENAEPLPAATPQQPAAPQTQAAAPQPAQPQPFAPAAPQATAPQPTATTTIATNIGAPVITTTSGEPAPAVAPANTQQPALTTQTAPATAAQNPTPQTQPTATNTPPAQATAPAANPATPAQPQATAPQAAPVAPTAHQPYIAPQQGQVIQATVIGHEPTGEALVQTPSGVLRLNTSTTLPIGTTLTVEITQVAAGTAQAAAVTLAPVTELAQQWSSLQQIFALLGGREGFAGLSFAPQGLPQILDNPQPLPNGAPPTGFSAGLMLFVSALRGGDFRNWLGRENSQWLEDSGHKGLLDKASGEFTLMARQFTNPPPNQWQTLFFPIAVEGELQQVRMFTKRERKQENRQQAAEEDTRFIVEMELSALGQMQMDGFIRQQQDSMQFDLMVRSTKALPDEVQKDIQAIYQSTAELTGYHGTLQFQAAKTFPVRPMEDVAAQHLGDVVA